MGSMTSTRERWAMAMALVCGCQSGGTARTPSDATGDSSGTDTGSTASSTDTSGADTGEPSGCEPTLAGGFTPMRRLTREQFANAIDELLGLEADVTMLEGDERLGAFASNLTAPVSLTSVQQYRVAAETLAEAGMPALVAALDCDPLAQLDCVAGFIASFGRRGFRRALTNDELARYQALADTGADPIDSMRLVVVAMLQSPHFLYVVELDEPDAEGFAALTGEQLATRMALFLWNSIPDDALLDAAMQGGLDGASDVRAEAERMLLDPRARAAVASFHRQWLAIDGLEATTKDPEVYPAFDAGLRTAMQDETRRFVEAVVLQGDGRLQTLLTADWSYADGSLAELYGVAPSPTPGEPVTLDASQRAGLLTHASFLATHAHIDQSGPVQRGVVVLTNMFCAPPPPPPPNANVQPPDPDPNATTRELFDQHTQDPACAGCHAVIDGVGLGFEGYDGIGRYRETEHGMAVDRSGELVGTDVDGPFVGAVELAARMAGSAQVHACVTRQWFRFAVGRFEQDADACTLAALDAGFAASDGDVRALMLDIVASDGFRHRDAEGGQ
jgi:Protein of unknown function (DUF1592)/Protein of unknown function (DUF1588)/Protein of unknown function (DUF1595)/Protein of unknown function (DUF1585)/Protein of unknown function (DUF1587)